MSAAPAAVLARFDLVDDGFNVVVVVVLDFVDAAGFLVLLLVLGLPVHWLFRRMPTGIMAVLTRRDPTSSCVSS